MAPIRLFCLPYAGGSAWIFRGLAQRLAHHVEVVALDLPGRGARRAQPLLDDWHALVPALTAELRPQLDRPYALLGYSLGAVVALEVAAALAARPATRSPLALVACAAPGPEAMRPGALHLLEDRAMFDGLRHLGGVPDEVMDSPELLAIAAPTLRADLRLFEGYRRPERDRLARPIFAYHGRDDASVGERYLAWQAETSGPFRHRSLAGGHMFLHEAEEDLARALVEDLGQFRAAVALV